MFCLFMVSSIDATAKPSSSMAIDTDTRSIGFEVASKISTLIFLPFIVNQKKRTNYSALNPNSSSDNFKPSSTDSDNRSNVRSLTKHFKIASNRLICNRSM